MESGQILSHRDPFRAFAYRCSKVAGCFMDCYLQNVEEFLQAGETNKTTLSGWKCPNNIEHPGPGG